MMLAWIMTAGLAIAADPNAAEAGQTEDLLRQAAQLENLPAPGPNASAQEIANYWSAKLRQTRLYRRARDFERAGKLLSMIESAGKADQAVIEERALWYQDQQKWGGAAVVWRRMMERLAPQAQEQDKDRVQYFKWYFQYIRCLYLYGESMNRQDYQERAARIILGIEEVHPDTMGAPGLREAYARLLQDHPKLKAEYDKAKKVLQE